VVPLRASSCDDIDVPSFQKSICSSINIVVFSLESHDVSFWLLLDVCFSSDWVFALQKSEQSLCCPKIYTEFLMSALSFLTAVVLSNFFSEYCFDLTRKAHLRELTSLTLVVLVRWCLPL
jgi:hypothetical protein